MEDNHFYLKSLQYDLIKTLQNHNLEEQGLVQQYIDSKCLQYCESMVPKDSNALIESGIINTNIGSGLIKYSTPYARRWYYMPANFQEAPQRGNYWFERMKQQYATSILEGASRLLK